MKSPKYLPRWWYVVLAIVLILGIVLVAWNPPAPSWLSDSLPSVLSGKVFLLVGIFLFSLAVSDPIVFFAMRGMDNLLDLSGDLTGVEDLWGPPLVGMAEGIMYPVSFLFAKPDFIGVWLAVKVAGQWVRWGTAISPPEGNYQKDQERVREANKGRRRFNKFLIGNALRIMLAFVTYWILSAVGKHA